MELINVTGYLAEEKLEIAKKFLVPKQLGEHGLAKDALKIDRTAMQAIIDEYTHESGVRGLEKQIAKIARVTAKKIALGEEYPAVIKKEHLKEYLGLPTNFHDLIKGNEAPGVVTGLAWTQMGGEILFVESSVSGGKGVMSMTGNLGDVMKESATIAYQYIKAHPEDGQNGFEDLRREGFARPRARRRHPEGRPFGGYHDGELDGVRAARPGPAPRHRDDG
jgi:ATP-dependent Lon protease, bacterial type